jgi:hypothetical protein
MVMRLADVVRSLSPRAVKGVNLSGIWSMKTELLILMTGEEVWRLILVIDSSLVLAV